jgi:hypothetical protein
MSGFTVNTELLAKAGTDISSHGAEAQAIQQQLNGAEVPTLAWGELGMMTGLFPAYLALLNDLRDHLQQMGVHLDNTGGLLGTVKETYEETDKAIATKLKGIEAGMATGGAIAGPLGAAAGGLVGASAPKGQDVLNSVPLAGNAFKAFSDYYKAADAVGKGDAAEAGQSAGEVASDVTGFAADAMSLSDPLNFLISKGLGFLESFLTPLKDALHLVTGDPDTLKSCAEKFNELAKSIRELADKVEQTALGAAQDWTGDAAPAAGKTIGETKQSIDSTAEAAGHVATLLRVSAILMQAAYDIINGIISDVIEWLVVTWVAAQAAAVFTLGASEGAAAAATVPEVAAGAEQAATKTDEAASLLQKIMNVLKKIMELLKKLKDTALTKFMKAEKVDGKVVPKGAGAKNFLGNPDEAGKATMETFDQASAKVAARTGTEATANQAAGQMIRDNLSDKIVESAKEHALDAVGLNFKAEGVTEAVHKGAEDASHILNIAGGVYQATEYSADPGGSGENQDQSGSGEGA